MNIEEDCDCPFCNIARAVEALRREGADPQAAIEACAFVVGDIFEVELEVRGLNEAEDLRVVH